MGTKEIKVSFYVEIPEDIYAKCTSEEINEWLRFNIGETSVLNGSAISNYEIRNFEVSCVSYH